MTCGDGRVLLIYAPVARSRGLLKESSTFLSFVRRNNLATETSQRRVKCASPSTSCVLVLVIILCLFFQAQLHPSLAQPLTHTHTHASRPPRFDDGSLPPPSSFHRFRTFSTFVPVTLARNSSVTSRLSSLKLIGKYSICTRGDTRLSTVHRVHM